MKRVHRRCAAAALGIGTLIGSTLGLGLGLVPTAASQADPAAPTSSAPLEYRIDGAAWSATPPPLFPSSWSPVPGGSTQSTLELRSTRAAPTIVAVYTGSATSSAPEVLQATTFTVANSRTALADFGSAAEPCKLVAPQAVLTPGQTLTIPAGLTIAPELESGQHASLSFNLLVAASDTGPVKLSNGCPIDPAIVQAFPTSEAAPAATSTAPRLQRTGTAQLPATLLWCAGIAATAGAALLGLRRGRQNRAPGQPHSTGSSQS